MLCAVALLPAVGFAVLFLSVSSRRRACPSCPPHLLSLPPPRARGWVRSFTEKKSLSPFPVCLSTCCTWCTAPLERFSPSSTYLAWTGTLPHCGEEALHRCEESWLRLMPACEALGTASTVTLVESCVWQPSSELSCVPPIRAPSILVRRQGRLLAGASAA